MTSQRNKTEIWTYGEIRKSINPLVRESGYFFQIAYHLVSVLLDARGTGEMMSDVRRKMYEV